MRATLLTLTLALAACHNDTAAEDTGTATGTATTTATGTATDDPTGDPTDGEPQVVHGRDGKRMNVDQLTAALLAATGQQWTEKQQVLDYNMPNGYREDPAASMLEHYAATLGRADYRLTVRENLDPGVAFSKLASDAARVACKRALDSELGGPDPSAHILLLVGAKDTLASAPDAVAANLRALVLRFWGLRLPADDPALERLKVLFAVASTAPSGLDADGTARPLATPLDGWRAVCVALATDPLFLTY